MINSLSIPVIVAPMSGVSGPELVSASCRAGVIGSFPAHEATSSDELDAWLRRIQLDRQRASDAGLHPAPMALNLVMRLKSRLEGDVRMAIKHRVPLVIASVGSPRDIIPILHDSGTRVFADVANLRHVHKCLGAGADGLVLLTAGAGGNTGWVNPFAFVRAVREFYEGPVVLAGGVSDGVSLRAAIILGCDLAFMGTAFIATTESRAAPAYKAALLESDLDRVIATTGPEGLTTNMIRDTSWSAGHSVSGVKGVCSVAEMVARLKVEWDGSEPTSARPAWE
ncbi:MAG: nitronate monooxygenase [Chloroflexi bacterium]|nr:nitronate monooxygenase [Chloroflexota bacterium]